MNSERSGIKVGIFVTVALGILGSLILSIGQADFFKSTKRYHIRFHYSNGLQINSPVHYIGVPVGKVTEINIVQEDENDVSVKQVEVTVEMHADVVLLSSDRVRVDTLGLMGEKFVDIVQGPLDEHSVVLPKDGVLCGQESANFSHVLGMGQKIGSRLDSILTSLDEVISNNQFKAELKGIVHDLHGVVSSNKDGLNETLAHMKQSSVYLEQTLDQAKGIVTDNRANIQEMVSSAKGFTKKIERSPSSLIWKSREERIAEREAEKARLPKENPKTQNHGWIFSRKRGD